MMRLVSLIACGLLWASGATAQNVVIENGKVWTMDGVSPLEGGDVWIRGSSIAGVGRTINGNGGSTRIDASGRWVTPGIINAFSHLGAVEVDAVSETRDYSANAPDFSAALDVSYALEPSSTLVAVTRMEGVTRTAVAPYNTASIFNGLGAVIHLGEGMQTLMSPKAFMFVSLGERGARMAGGSKAAALVTLREALAEAGSGLGSDRFDNLLGRIDVAALKPVARGDTPLFVAADSAADIRTLLDLKRARRRLKLVLVGANEGWMVADEIAAAKVPVITDATVNMPTRFETMGATLANAARLKQAGVRIAIATGPTADSTHNARLVLQLAGIAVSYGLPWQDALAAITSDAAQILGIGGQVGSLTPGKRADVVLWDGDPLEVTSRPVAVFINGRSIPLESRQTKLRDRYRALGGQIPFAYRK